jgi:hypothetical protein
MANHPEVRLARNLKLVGRSDIGGHPNTGEGIAIKFSHDGRRIMYLANENPPICFSVLDVTEPSDPKVVWQLPRSRSASTMPRRSTSQRASPTSSPKTAPGSTP